MLSRRTMLLISQVYVVVLSYAFAAYPHYVWLLFIIYLGLMLGLGMYSARGSFGKGVNKAEVERARQLFREDNALQLAMEDEELLALYTKQIKGMTSTLLIMVFYLPLFYIVSHYYKDIVARLQAMGIGSQTIAGFIVWLSLFEFMTIIGLWMQRRTGVMGGGPPPMPSVPQRYVVTDKGIVIKGAMGRVIGFPLPEGSKVELNESKGYVEITDPKGVKIRLYSSKARRLYDLITRYGLGEKRRSETKKESKRGSR